MSKVLKHKKTRKTGIDGIIEEEEIAFSVKTSVQPFSVLYSKELAAATMGKLRASDYTILFILVDKAEFNTGIIALPAEDRKEIVSSLGINPQSFTNTLHRLRTTDVITGMGGKYRLNPKYLWKGTTNSRNRALKELNQNLYDRPNESPGHKEEFGEDKESLRRGRLGNQSSQGIPNQTEIFEEGTEEI